MSIHSLKSDPRARSRQDAQRTPSPARGTRADILFACALQCFLGVSTLCADEESSARWARHSISGITPTNAPTPVPPAEPPTHPSRAALEKLTQPDDSDGEPAPEWRLARDRRIAEFGEYRSVDKETVDERMERTRVRLRIEEANMLSRRGEHEAASQLLRDALENVDFDSSRFEIHRRLGSLAFRLQHYERAERHMAEALTLRPDDPGTASSLAAVQMTLGKLDAALETLESIRVGLIDQRQLLFSFHFNLACLYSLKEQKEKALEHLLQAAESDPPSAFASLGDPQLDAIRDDLRFRELQVMLEAMLGAE